MTGARVALVGAHGHGSTYLNRLDRCAAAGKARLVAVADPRGAGELADRTPGASWYPGLSELLDDPAAHPDVVVIATPIDTHRELAVAAMEAGCDVLLEKPTASSLADAQEISAAAARTGRLCQVGFQTFGSGAVDVLRKVVADGEVGEVLTVGALGTWVRPAGYWGRAAWAGRRRLRDREVVDGVTTNPLAHAVATALLVAGATKREDVAGIEVDLYRANDIEADDTSSGVVTLRGGGRLGFGLTLCAPNRSPASVVVRGDAGDARLWYESDTVEVAGRRGAWASTTGRVDLLDDLLEARSTGAPLRCPVESTGAFMSVLEAVRTAPDPQPVEPAHVSWEGEGAEQHAVVRDVEHWCARAASEAATFAALGAPWARSA